MTSLSDHTLTNWFSECQKRIKLALASSDVDEDAEINPISEFLKYVFQKRKEYYRKARRGKDSDSDTEFASVDESWFTPHEVDVHFLAILLDAVELSTALKKFEIAVAIRLAVGNWEKRHMPTKWKLSQALQKKMFQELIVLNQLNMISDMYHLELKLVESKEKEFANEILLYNLEHEIDFDTILLALDSGANAFGKAIHIIENQYLNSQYKSRNSQYHHMREPNYKRSTERALRLAAIIICKEGRVRQGRTMEEKKTIKPKQRDVSASISVASTEQSQNSLTDEVSLITTAQRDSESARKTEITDGFLLTKAEILYIYRYIGCDAPGLKTILRKSNTTMGTKNEIGIVSETTQTIANYIHTEIT
jgi:hypothetical protein